jgi:hypothetical protein
MSALTGNLGPCLDRFAMWAAILAILSRQTTATWVSTAVLALIVHKQSFLTSLFLLLPSHFDLIEHLLDIGNSRSEFLSMLPLIRVVNTSSEGQHAVLCFKTDVLFL